MKIRLSATDETGRAFEGTIDNLDSLGRAGERVESSFDRVGRAVNSVSNIAERGLAISARYEISQLSLQGAAERVRAAEERAIRARIEYGEESRRTAEANRQLEAALRDQEKTQIRANLSMALAVGNVAGLAVQSVQAARALGPLITGLRGAAVGATALSIASSGPLAPLTALAIAGGVAAVALSLDNVGTSAPAAAEGLSAASVAADMAAERMERLREKFVFGQDLHRAGALALNNLTDLRAAANRLEDQMVSLRSAIDNSLAVGATEGANILILQLDEVVSKAAEVKRAIEEIEAPAKRAAEAAAARALKTQMHAAELAAKAKEAQIDREIAAVERLRQKQNQVREEMLSQGNRVLRESSSSFTLRQFEDLSQVVYAKGGSLEDLALNMAGFASFLFDTGARQKLGLPFIRAATGFHGEVDRPTLFMAGEAGRESVNISPGGGAGGGAGGPVQIYVDARGSNDPSAVRAAARRGAEEGARTFTNRRMATRRTR